MLDARLDPVPAIGEAWSGPLGAKSCLLGDGSVSPVAPPAGDQHGQEICKERYPRALAGLDVS